MIKIILNNFWLKITALLLALISWFYIVSELNKGTPEEKTFFEQILPARISAKEVPIKVNLIGKPPAGYRVLDDAITIKPSSCVIMAQRNLLTNIPYLTTDEIDIGEYTKSVTKQVSLKPVGHGIIFDKDSHVVVVIPVQKIEREGNTVK